MLALGAVKVIDHLDGMKAAQKLLSPLMRPLMGLPGSCGLTLIASLQSTDAAASMTKGSVRRRLHHREAEGGILRVPVLGRFGDHQLFRLGRGAVPIYWGYSHL